MTDVLSTIAELQTSFTAEEHGVTRVVCRSRLEGRDIGPEAVAATLGTSLTAIERAVDDLIERGTMEREADAGELVVTRGLSLAETPHRLTRDGRQLYACCAVGAVGIPAGLRVDAPVEALRHVWGARVTLALSDGTVTDASPGTVISDSGTRSYALPPPLHVTAQQCLCSVERLESWEVNAPRTSRMVTLGETAAAGERLRGAMG